MKSGCTYTCLPPKKTRRLEETMETRQIAEQIHERFSGRADVSVEEIEERLDNLINEFKVPEDEARRSVTSHFAKEAGINRDELGDSDVKRISDITGPDEWMTLEAQVVELWESTSEAVAQTGLLGDESGTIKFTAWSKSDIPELKEGESYRLENVVSDEFQDRLNVKLNSSTEVEELSRDIDVGSGDLEIEGALVDIQSGSGLIKRCTEEDCTRVLQNGRCSEHGDVEGEFDLRIKAVIDDGREVHDVIFDRETTEELTGITMEEAKEEAMDALDTSIVTDRFHSLLVGRYFHVKGPEFGRYVLADEVEELTAEIDTEELLIEARSLGGVAE